MEVRVKGKFEVSFDQVIDIDEETLESWLEGVKKGRGLPFLAGVEVMDNLNMSPHHLEPIDGACEVVHISNPSTNEVLYE